MSRIDGPRRARDEAPAAVALQLRGYDTVAAHDARTQLRAGLQPCVIVLDWMMPNLDRPRLPGRGLWRRTRRPVTYVLACLHCGSTVARTERVGDAEAATVETHLRAEHADQLPVDQRPDFAEVFGHVRVKMA